MQKQSVSRSTPMQANRTVVWLSSLIAMLALVAAGMGLFYQDGGSPFTVTSVRGQSVELYGEGLYRYDTLFAAAGNKGTDMVTLFLAIPLLLLFVLLYRRGSLRGGLLLMGALTWFLYVYASYALGAVAYNTLFLLYVVLFGTSFFALILAFRSFDVRTLPSYFSDQMPRRGPAIFMFVSGLVTLTVWIITPISALMRAAPPDGLDTYTTLFTHALDIAIIVPTAFLAGVLILRRDPLGYLLVFPLLILEAFLAPMITMQTVNQLRVGVTFQLSQIVGPISGFVTIAVIAIWFLAAMYRNISDPDLPRPATTQAAHA